MSIAVLVLAVLALLEQRSLLARLLFGILTLIGGCSTLVSIMFYISCRKNHE